MILHSRSLLIITLNVDITWTTMTEDCNIQGFDHAIEGHNIVAFAMTLTLRRCCALRHCCFAMMYVYAHYDIAVNHNIASDDNCGHSHFNSNATL